MANKLVEMFLFRNSIVMAGLICLSFYASHNICVLAAIVYMILNFIFTFIFSKKVKMFSPLIAKVQTVKKAGIAYTLSHFAAAAFFVSYVLDMKSVSVMFFLYFLMFMKARGITPVFGALFYRTFEVKFEDSRKTFILLSRNKMIHGNIKVVEIGNGILMEVEK